MCVHTSDSKADPHGISQPLLPNLLVIGAMKAGTTSLWADLGRSPEIFVTRDKEPGDIGLETILTNKGLKAYSKNFSGSEGARFRVDCSTNMAKSPQVYGVPERALKVLDKQVRIIYMTRDPVARLLSQYRHETALGYRHDSLSAALVGESNLVDWGRYAYQLDQWQRVIPPDQIFISSLEDYTYSRTAFFDHLSRFLDIDLSPVSEAAPEQRNFKAVGPRGRLGRLVVEHPLYRREVSHLVPDLVKNAARRGFEARRSWSERRSATTSESNSLWNQVPDSTRQRVLKTFAIDAQLLEDEWGYAPPWR